MRLTRYKQDVPVADTVITDNIWKLLYGSARGMEDISGPIINNDTPLQPPQDYSPTYDTIGDNEISGDYYTPGGDYYTPGDDYYTPSDDYDYTTEFYGYDVTPQGIKDTTVYQEISSPEIYINPVYTSPDISDIVQYTRDVVLANDITISPVTNLGNVTPTFYVAANDIAPGVPWEINESQRNISSAMVTNETLCISTLVQASHWCYLYGIGFLVVVALLLNGLSFVIFRAKPLKRFAFSTFFTALAIIDSIALGSHIPRKWLNDLYGLLGWGEGITFYDSNTIACKGITYFAYVFRFLSSWLVVALISERMVVSTNPYKGHKIRTVKSAHHALLYASVSALIVNAHVVFIWQSVSTGPDRHSCVPVSPSDFISIALTITTVLSIVGLPFIVVSGLTAMTIRNFSSWKVRPRRMTTSAISRSLLERQATVMVVSVGCIFSLLCIPYAISWSVLLLQHFAADITLCQYIEAAAARDITEVSFMLNYAIKFLVCIFTGRNVLNRRSR